MKKTVLGTCLILALTAGLAGAEDIKGKFGITGRIGFYIPADSEMVTSGVLANVDTDAGFYGGGGFIYGIQNYLAVDIEATHTSFNGDYGSEGDITDVGFGVQYRFPDKHGFTPYAGGGLDVLINDFTVAGHNFDVDTTVGLHAKGGVDYFLTKDLALNAEGKAVFSPTADIKDHGFKVGNFDPSGFSGTMGIRYFFY